MFVIFLHSTIYHGDASNGFRILFPKPQVLSNPKWFFYCVGSLATLNMISVVHWAFCPFLKKTRSWKSGLLTWHQQDARNILEGKNEQVLNKTTTVAVENAQQSEHEEVYMTSWKSSTEKSSAGNHQPGYFKCQAHYSLNFHEVI